MPHGKQKDNRLYSLPFSHANPVGRWYQRSLAILLAVLVLGLFPLNAFGQSNAIVRLAAFEYPPFFYKKDHKIRGIGVDLGQALFKRLKLKTDLNMYPLKRALIYIQQGRLDATMILIRSAERETYLTYSDPLIPGSGHIWFAADRKEGPIYFQSLEDLRPYRIGVVFGYSYGKAMDEFLKTVDIDPAPTEYQTFRKLLFHRVELVPATSIVAKNLIKTHPEFYGKFAYSDNAFLESNYFIGISKKSPLAKMMPQINQAIADMKAEGVITSVIKAYTE